MRGGIDIEGAFLNADMSSTGVLVHMRLDRIMSAILIQIDPTYAQYLETNGSMKVQLDKALYGCIEASAPRHKDFRDNLLQNGFQQNPYDLCVYNKLGHDGKQITIVVHVDDLLVTSVSLLHIDAFGTYLKSVYPETKTS